MSVQGATLFSDPNGEEWMLLAAGGRTFATRPNNVAREVSLNGNTLTGDCSFTQAFDRLILWRGTDETPLVLNDFAAGWQAVTQTTSESGAGTGTQPIPNSDGAAFYQNRVFVPFVYTDKKDFVAVGDIGNYTRYAYPQNAFRFNDGTDDEIVDLAPFGRSSMVVFKEKSVRIVDGLTPDTSGNYTGAFLDVVSDTHGLVAPRAWATVGRDLFYVSTNGVTSLRLTEENKVKGVDLPLSAPLSATWARIKWSLRNRIRMAYWDSKLYVAVPLDDARAVGGTSLTAGLNYILGARTINVTAGEHYLYTPGANDTSLTNGSETFYGGSSFVAAGSTVTLAGSGNNPITATLYRYDFYDVNNAVLVYDFITEAWAGADQTDGVTHVKEWLTPTIDGRKRLVAATEDGLLRLWEEGFEDEVVTAITYPWWDIQVVTAPTNGEGFNFSTSSNPVANNAYATNTTTRWGTDTAAHARANLYAGLTGSPSWGLSAAATAAQLDWGVRLTSTNTSVVAITYDSYLSFTQTVPVSCELGCLRFDLFSGSYITTQAVSMSVTTRGYPCQDPDQKRYQTATLRLETWNPTYTVGAVYDGVNETDSPLTAQTRDRTQYTAGPGGVTTDWASTNVNDDHGNPWRQDYSVTLGAGFNFGSGVNLGLHQSTLVPALLTRRGVFAELTLANTTGRCLLNSVTLDALPGDRTRTLKYT